MKLPPIRSRTTCVSWADLIPLPPPSQIATDTLAAYPHARHIAFLLVTYPVVNVALKTHEPSGVVTFAFTLAHACYVYRVLGKVIVEENLYKAREKMFFPHYFSNSVHNSVSHICFYVITPRIRELMKVVTILTRHE